MFVLQWGQRQLLIQISYQTLSGVRRSDKTLHTANIACGSDLKRQKINYLNFKTKRLDT